MLANLPYLAGLFDPNPFVPVSGLGSVTHGLIADGRSTLDANNGFVSQALGHRAALDLLHFRFPWWNPYEGLGEPLAGEMQSAALFPLTLLTALSNGQLYEHMLLELIAGWSTFLLLRRLDLGRVTSTAGGIAFMLNGTFAWFTHATVNPVAFLPLLLLGIEVAYAAVSAGRRGGWWLIAVAAALSVYAGFPEVAFVDALLAVVWTVWRASGLRDQHLRAFVGKTVTGAIVATLLSAPLLLAFFNYLSHAYVWLHSSGVLGALRLTHLSFAQLLLPYVYGPLGGGNLGFGSLVLWGYVGGYLSTSLLLMSLLGVQARGHRGLRIALAVWIVVAMSRIYRGPPVLRDVLNIVPGISHVEFARYAFPSLSMAVIVLAALGLDNFRLVPERRRVVISAAVSLAILAFVVYEMSGLDVHWYFPVSLVWGVVIVVVGATIALVCPARSRLMLLAGLLAIDALALFVVPELSAPRGVKVDMTPVAFLRRHLGKENRFFTLGPFTPNYGSYFGLASLNAEDVPVPSIFSRYVHTRLDPGADATSFKGSFDPYRRAGLPSSEQELLLNIAGYRAAGVSYVLTSPGTDLPQSSMGLQRVFESPSTWIYHLSGAQPFFTATAPGCRVGSADRGSARVSCPVQTTLIRRETDLPGWSASIDGRPTAIRKNADVFQAVTVPAGIHRVTFDYAPPNIGWGLTAFLAGLTWLLIGAVRARLPKRG